MIAAATVLLAACGHPSGERWQAMSDRFAFDGGAAERLQLERSAKNGDADAALRLGRYCQIIERDEQAALRWYDLSARLGSADGAHNARELRSAIRESRKLGSRSDTDI